MNVRAPSRVLKDELDSLEIDLVMEGVRRRYGYDLREYAPALVRREIRRHLSGERLSGIPALLDRVLREPACFQRLLSRLSPETEPMFHPPRLYRTLRARVAPFLRTYSSIRAWVVGCGSGEEAWSLAILLQEEFPRNFMVYATDVNEAAIEKASSGALPEDRLKEYSARYAEAGGRKTFEDYTTLSRGRRLLRPSIRDRIVFASHHPSTDGSFNEFNLVLCRNVLPAFLDPLRRKMYTLAHQSLEIFGVLGLGPRDDLCESPFARCYEKLAPRDWLYRKIRA